MGHPRSGWQRLGYWPHQDVRWRSRSSSNEPLAKQDQGLGQWRGCDLPSGLMRLRASHARVLKCGLEFSAERSLESGRTRWRRCMTGCQWATSCAWVKSCWNGNNGCLHGKGWRKVNHRVIEQAPGSGHVLRKLWPKAHAGLAWVDGLMDQLHRAHDNGRAANAPAQTRNLTEHRAAQID